MNTARLLLAVGLISLGCSPAFAKAYGGRLTSPGGLSDTAGWYSLAGSASDSTYVLNGSTVVLIADRSGNSPTNGIFSNGGASNSVTSATKSVTGSQAFSWNGILSTYRPAGNVTLASKTSGNDGFSWLLLTTGVMRLTVGDGAALTNYDSSAAMTTGAYATRTLTATYTDGGSGNVVFAVDGVQLGTTVSTVKTLTNAATSLTIGAANQIGGVYRLTVGSVYDCNPSGAAKLATSFSSAGDNYTVNTSGDLGVRICGARDLVQLTAANQPTFSAASGYNVATFDGVNDYMRTALFSMNVLGVNTTFYLTGKQVSWSGLRCMADLGDNSGTGQFQVRQNPSTPQVILSITGGTDPSSISPAIGATSVICAGTTTSNGPDFIRLNLGAANAGTHANVGIGAVCVGARWATTTADRFCNVGVSEIVVRSVADSDALQQQIIGYEVLTWGGTF